MTEFLSKTRASCVVENVAEYLVMLFVAAMTGVSTLRLGDFALIARRRCLSINLLDFRGRTVYNSDCIT